MRMRLKMVKMITMIMKMMRRVKRIIVKCTRRMRITQMIFGVMNYKLKYILNKNMDFFFIFSGIKVPLRKQKCSFV